MDGFLNRGGAPIISRCSEIVLSTQGLYYRRARGTPRLAKGGQRGVARRKRLGLRKRWDEKFLPIALCLRKQP